MKLTLLSKILKLTVFKKALAYKGGSLLAVGVAGSITLTSVLKEVFQGVLMRDIWVLILLMFSALGLYLLFWITDFITGLRAARYLHFVKTNQTSGWMTSDKLYNSFGKIGGVLLIKALMFFVCIATLIAKINFGFYSAIAATVFLDVLAVGFEFKSIGENLEKKTGNKPMLFRFFDRVFGLLEEGFIKKLKTYF